MTIEDFVDLARGECGLPLTVGELHTDFDKLAGWDSLHLLKLLSALEAATGRALPAARFLEARSLADLHMHVRAAV